MARGGSWAAVASSSQGTWVGYRLDHERITMIHITKIRSLNLVSPVSLCLVPREGPLQPVPGALRGVREMAALAGSCRERHPKCEEESKLWVVWDGSSIADMSVAVTWWSWESLFLQWAPAGAPPRPWLHFPLCSSLLIPTSLQAYVGICIKQTYMTSSHRSYWSEKQFPMFCQLVHTSCMAHLGIGHLTFGCSLRFALHSENLRLNRGGISLPSVTSKWLSDFWGFQILVGRIYEKPFGVSGSLFSLSNCSGDTSSSSMIRCAIRLQLKQSCLCVCRVSLWVMLFLHILLVHYFKWTTSPMLSSETTVPPSVKIMAEFHQESAQDSGTYFPI